MFVSFGNSRHYEMPVDGIDDFEEGRLVIRVLIRGNSIEELHRVAKNQDIIRTYLDSDSGASAAVYTGYKLRSILLDADLEVVTVELHKPTELEMRVERLEESQEAQDIAIDDLGAFISDIIDDPDDQTESEEE